NGRKNNQSRIHNDSGGCNLRYEIIRNRRVTSVLNLRRARCNDAGQFLHISPVRGDGQAQAMGFGNDRSQRLGIQSREAVWCAPATSAVESRLNNVNATAGKLPNDRAALLGGGNLPGSSGDRGLVSDQKRAGRMSIGRGHQRTGGEDSWAVAAALIDGGAQ